MALRPREVHQQEGRLDLVGNAAAAVEAVRSAGGEIVEPVDPHGREVVATLRDPAGNVLGIYQEPGLAEPDFGSLPG